VKVDLCPKAVVSELSTDTPALTSASRLRHRQLSTHSLKKELSGGKNPGMSASGFTLVEILVVVAIILILAGLILSALMSAWDSGDKVTCAGNLRQLGLGLRMFYSDYAAGTVTNDAGTRNGMMIGPPTNSVASSAIYTASTTNAVNHGRLYANQYLLSLGVFYCPTASSYSKNNSNTGASNWGSVVNNVRSSYLWRNVSGGAVTNDCRKSTFAVALDDNSTSTNKCHKGKFANILYGDGHVRGVADGTGGSFSGGNLDLIFTWADTMN
jgi:prepilin-type N-terminal cleavage/methylation domain-containing protein/prepilin-type processing-associated H-X9-DG protein